MEAQAELIRRQVAEARFRELDVYLDFLFKKISESYISVLGAHHREMMGVYDRQMKRSRSNSGK